jgi:hypothetical protein
VLNEALATEIVCVLRYRFHYFMATGIHSRAVAKESLEYAQEEQEHADQIATRIRQLGGKPEMDPAVVAQTSPTEYKEGTSLADMLREEEGDMEIKLPVAPWEAALGAKVQSVDPKSMRWCSGYNGPGGRPRRATAALVWLGGATSR